jgi:hypothetical protein
MIRQLPGHVAGLLANLSRGQVVLTGGVGLGLWSIEDVNESGLGLIMGVQFAVWQSGRHSLFLGLDYAPAFTDPGTVHNIGILFGWQLL